MINKKLMILAIFLVSLLTVSAVSAADNAAEDIASAEENQTILKENNDVGTFDALQKEIDNAPEGSVLNLTKDYNGAEDAVVWLNKDLTLDGQGHTIDCLGDDCSAFYSDAGKITLKNLKIINGYNDDNYKGGAIYIGDAAQYTIINCTFINNWADDYGGAIYNGANKLTIRDCSFNNNEADDNCGGAIYSKGELEIKNSKLTSNTADDDGGAVYCENYILFENCVFENNLALIDGGAIYAKDRINVKNSEFRNNKAVGSYFHQCYGGAIRSEYDVEVDASTFIGNHAYDYGGAIYANTATVSSSSFIENYVDDNDGGALYLDDSVRIDSCTFEGNHALVDGGAIHAQWKVIVGNTVFRNNKADGPADSECSGGAIECDVGTVIVESCTFEGNHAYDWGGAISAQTVTWRAFPSYFIGNYVEDNEGGAIYANFDTDVEYGVFINNTVKSNDDGGAIYVRNNTRSITFSKCYFENNRCGDEGGAIYVSWINADLTLRSNIFVDNWAGDRGNIVYNKGNFEKIEYNWYGSNSFDFSNELVEYHFGGSDESHTDEHMLNARMYIDENVTVGKEAGLTIYFSDGNTPGDLFDIDASFIVDNGAVLSDWHKFFESTYATGITFANTNVTHITAQVHNQILELDVTPLRGNLTLNVSAEPISVGENATVIVTGLENATGEVFVVANFTEWSGKIDKGVAKIIVPGLKESTTAIVTFYADDNYNPAQTSVNIAVNRHNLTIEAIAKPMTVGANATVIVTGLKNATGNITVTVNNKTYTAPIKDGKSKVLIAGITQNVTASVEYGGDEWYNPASATVNITVNPAVDTRLQSRIYLRNALYFVTDTKIVRLTLWDGNSKPIAGRTVHITLNEYNLTYSGITDENGDAYIRVGVGFGVHSATVSFDGDDVYAASNRTGQIKVIKESPSVMVREANTHFKASTNPKIVKVYLWDRSSKPLPLYSFVAIKIDGQTFSGYTDSNGIASIQINVTDRGIFNAQVAFGGNSAYNGVSRSVKFTIS